MDGFPKEMWRREMDRGKSVTLEHSMMAKADTHAQLLVFTCDVGSDNSDESAITDCSMNAVNNSSGGSRVSDRPVQ